MPRQRKPIEQHKLDGTYRKDRHGNSAEALVGSVLEVPTNILPPDTLKDDYCREHYKYHVNHMAKLKILSLSDIPEIDIMYDCLQRYRKINTALSELSPASEEYAGLSRLLLKFGAQFSAIAAKYYISPSARNKVKIEELAIQKEEVRQTSLTAKLIGKKKA
jgi:hypothetical protein